MFWGDWQGDSWKSCETRTLAGRFLRAAPCACRHTAWVCVTGRVWHSRVLSSHPHTPSQISIVMSKVIRTDAHTKGRSVLAFTRDGRWVWHVSWSEVCNQLCVFADMFSLVDTTLSFGYGKRIKEQKMNQLWLPTQTNPLQLLHLPYVPVHLEFIHCTKKAGFQGRLLAFCICRRRN